jgi:hypothetical protein
LVVLSAATDVTCGCRGWLRVAGTKVFVLCTNRPMNGEKSSPKHPAVKDVVMPSRGGGLVGEAVRRGR